MAGSLPYERALSGCITGSAHLKIFGRGQEESQRIREVSENFPASDHEGVTRSFLSGMVLEFMAAMAIALVAVMLGIRLLNRDIPFEQALLVLLLAPEFYRPLRDLGTSSCRHGRQGSRPTHERDPEYPSPTAKSLFEQRKASKLPQTQEGLTIEFTMLVIPIRQLSSCCRKDQSDITRQELYSLVGRSGGQEYAG